jgi:hypothetical protein
MQKIKFCDVFLRKKFEQKRDSVEENESLQMK